MHSGTGLTVYHSGRKMMNVGKWQLLMGYMCIFVIASTILNQIFHPIVKFVEKSGVENSLIRSTNTSEALNRTVVYTDEWLQRRKNLSQTSQHKKVLLFCYMRGGSSFFSEIFNQNDESLYWYEPIAAFYSANFGTKYWPLPQNVFWYQHYEGNVSQREVPVWEHKALAEHNSNMLNCDFHKLPIDSLIHRGFKQTNYQLGRNCMLQKLGRNIENCYRYLPGCKTNIESGCAHNIELANTYVEGKRTNTSFSKLMNYIKFVKCRNVAKDITSCLDLYKKRCSKSKIVAYKGLRLTMDSVDYMLAKDPDMQVLFFVRDPRAIVLSRIFEKLTFQKSVRRNPVIESKYLCKKMLKDYTVYKKLELKYPGAFKFIRYEDFVLNRYSYLEEIYNFIGMNIHNSVYTWMEKNLKAKVSGGGQSTIRANSTESIDKWKTSTTSTERRRMTSHCKDILKVFKYDVN